MLKRILCSVKDGKLIEIKPETYADPTALLSWNPGSKGVSPVVFSLIKSLHWDFNSGRLRITTSHKKNITTALFNLDSVNYVVLIDTKVKMSEGDGVLASTVRAILNDDTEVCIESSNRDIRIKWLYQLDHVEVIGAGFVNLFKISTLRCLEFDECAESDEKPK